MIVSYFIQYNDLIIFTFPDLFVGKVSDKARSLNFQQKGYSLRCLKSYKQNQFDVRASTYKSFAKIS